MSFDSDLKKAMMIIGTLGIGFAGYLLAKEQTKETVVGEGSTPPSPTTWSPTVISTPETHIEIRPQPTEPITEEMVLPGGIVITPLDGEYQIEIPRDVPSRLWY